MTGTARVDAMLAALPADQRRALQAVRDTVVAAAPQAEEAIGYGMPGFRYNGHWLLSYSAFKRHCSLFPGGAFIERHRDELAPFAAAKGTLHFTPEKPIPTHLVAEIVRERMAKIDAR
ncbi:MAG: iron chaperone [Candidatus Limnocylindrales bacterium]